MENNQSITLITGGTGFAGSHLVDELVQHQESSDIHVTYVTEIPSYMVGVLPEENFHKVDLSDQSATEELLQKVNPQKIYHLAAFSSVGDSFEKSKWLLQNNLTLQLNMLETVKNICPQARLLIIGSADGYGVSEESDEIPIREDHPFRPVNPYSVSKVAQELLAYAYAKSYSLQVIRVRPFNHIGERQTDSFAVASFAKQIVAIERGEQQSLQVGNLEAIRDFTDVKDVVKAYSLLMDQGNVGEVYNIGSGKGVSMADVVQMMCDMSEKTIKIETDPARVRALDIPVVIANNDKVKQLGWQPTISLENSLQRVLEYWRQQ